MTPELWALGGVVVGALLGIIGQIVNATLVRKWAMEERGLALAREQEQRLFDHRRVAYTKFIDAVQNVYLEHWDEVSTRVAHTVPDDAEKASRDIGRIHAAYIPVSIYGSTEASEAAAKVNAKMVSYVFATAINFAETTDVLELVREMFLERVRFDLGVPGATGELRAGPMDEDYVPSALDLL